MKSLTPFFDSSALDLWSTCSGEGLPADIPVQTEPSWISSPNSEDRIVTIADYDDLTLSSQQRYDDADNLNAKRKLSETLCPREFNPLLSAYWVKAQRIERSPVPFEHTGTDDLRSVITISPDDLNQQIRGNLDNSLLIANHTTNDIESIQAEASQLLDGYKEPVPSTKTAKRDSAAAENNSRAIERRFSKNQPDSGLSYRKMIGSCFSKQGEILNITTIYRNMLAAYPGIKSSKTNKQWQRMVSVNLNSHEEFINVQSTGSTHQSIEAWQYNGEPVKSIPAILRVPPEFLVISGSNAAFCQTTLFPKKADYPTNTPPLADPAKPFSIWCQEIGRGNADLTWTTLIANCFKGENLTIDNLIDVIGQKLLSRPNGMDDSTLRNTISYCLRRNECFTDISRGKGQKARGGFWEYTESLAKNINTMDSGQADGLNKAR